MKTKISSYQKLKLKNKELIMDIHTLIQGVNFLKIEEVKQKYNFLFEAGKIIWLDSPKFKHFEIK